MSLVGDISAYKLVEIIEEKLREGTRKCDPYGDVCSQGNYCAVGG